MATAFRKGVLTSPGATGNQTTNITTGGSWPASSTVQAIILWATYETAAGVFSASSVISYGFGTFDGGAAQQGYGAFHDTNGAGTMSCVQASNTTHILKGFTTASTTADYLVTLTSLGTDQFVLNWTDLPATASIKVHYVALGGSDITAARVHSFTPSTSSPQDVTVNAGFGQPDLMFFMSRQSGAFGDAVANSVFQLSVGDETSGWTSLYRSQQAASATLSIFQRPKAIGQITGNGTIEAEADIEPSKANWPTDGYRLLWTDLPVTTYPVVGLALKGTFTHTIGNNAAPTAAAPQVQNLALASGTPVGALLFGGNIPLISTIDQSHADLGGWTLGATDGTNEGCAGTLNEDSAAAAVTSRWHSETKAFQHYTPGATAVLASECDSAISGSNIELTWGDTDSIARAFGWVIIGSPAGGGAPIEVDLTAATETDSAQAPSVTKPIIVTLTPAAETNTAQTVTATKTVALTPAIEADTAQVLVKSKTAVLTPAAETDTAQALAAAKTLSLTAATETDAAQVLQYSSGGIHVTLTTAAEADTAQALALAKALGLTAATETDAAQASTAAKTRGLGSAVDFDGTSSYMQVTDSASLRVETNNAFSWAFWARLDSYNNNVLPRFWEKRSHYVALMGDATNGKYRQVALEIADSAGVAHEYWGRVDLDVGVWTHIAGTYDGTTDTCRMWINGIEDTVDEIHPGGAWGGTLQTTSGVDFYVARRRTDLLRNLDGAMDLLRIWNRVLTPTEIAQAYAGPVPATGLVARWDYDEESGTTTADSSGNGNTGTLISARWLHATVAPGEWDQAQPLSVTKPIVKTLTAAAETDAAVTVSYVKPIVKALTNAAETDAAQTLSITHPIRVTLVPTTELDVAVALIFSGGAPPPDTHPNLGGVVAEPSLGGVFDQTTTSGAVVTYGRDGVVTAHSRSGVVVMVARSGVVVEPVRDGNVAEPLLGGVFDESLTGGEVY